MQSFTLSSPFLCSSKTSEAIGAYWKCLTETELRQGARGTPSPAPQGCRQQNCSWAAARTARAVLPMAARWHRGEAQRDVLLLLLTPSSLLTLPQQPEISAGTRVLLSQKWRICPGKLTAHKFYLKLYWPTSLNFLKLTLLFPEKTVCGQGCPTSKRCP